MARLTVTYSDPEFIEDGEYSATISKDPITATDAIEWLTGVFESFGFGAVSVRINEEYSRSMFTPLDKRARDLIQRLKEEPYEEAIKVLED